MSNRNFSGPVFRILAVIVIVTMFFSIVPARAQGIVAVTATPPANMVLVPGGMYTVGSPDSDFYASEAAKPLHLVELSPYYIDRLEVNNRDYAQCVAAGACQEPTSKDSKTRAGYYSAAFDRFPVVNVTWEDANNYCQFVGKRLPTEAEWERAGMGTNGYQRFPWGNLLPRSYQMNLTGVPGDTEIGNGYPQGDSTLGVANMMDNVSEWVSDWYDPLYYAVSPTKNPAGPETGSEKVYRGGSFDSNIRSEHLTNRYALAPDQSSYSIGFRCAQDVPVQTTFESLFQSATETPQSYGFVQSGQREGIFIVDQAGVDRRIECIVPNGTVLSVYEGPIEKDYTFWIRVATNSGCHGWTLASSVLKLDDSGE